MAITLDGTTGSTQPSVAMSGATSGTVTLTPPAVAGTQGYTLPSALPTANGQALTATTAGVMSWAAAAGAGKVLQVVYSSPSNGTSSSQTLAEFATLAITPTSATSKIIFTFSGFFNGTGTSMQGGAIALYNKTQSTTLVSPGGTDSQGYSQLYFVTYFANGIGLPFSITAVDSPASTSAQTYQIQYAARNVAAPSSLPLKLCQIVLMEIAP